MDAQNEDSAKTSAAEIIDSINDRLVGVIGFGVSGRSACRHLLQIDARVSVFDSRPFSELGADAEQAKSAGARFFEGMDAAEMARCDMLIVSPGVPSFEALEEIATKIPVIGELEYAAYQMSKWQMIAVTGSNGKSSVVAMLESMLQHDERLSFVGGNYGTPLTEALSLGDEGIAVVEVSSYQLERIETFKPNVAVLLNISADHLDRYDSFHDYAAAKANIFRHQSKEDIAIVGVNDVACQNWHDGSDSKLLLFGSGGDAFFDDTLVVDGIALGVASDFAHIHGKNQENIAVAALAASRLGVANEAIVAGARTFRSLAHRLEFVADIDGVSYYDDSKATNVGAVEAAIESIRREHPGGHIVLILGGVDKGGHYTPIVEALGDALRSIVLLGEASDIIENEIGAMAKCVRSKSMLDAVKIGAKLASTNDIVLLSPACASFDMFKSYKDRGEVFQRAVKELGHEL